MYRIFCESYQNFLKTFEEENVRLKIGKGLKLLTDEKEYRKEQQKQSISYKKTSDLLEYIKENLDRYPKLKSFLWTLESRKMIGKKYNVVKQEELEEQTKLINSFLKLAYWY